MNLTDLQREAHAIAKEHGWWDEERTFGDLIALVHSELSEALEAYRERELEAYTPPDDAIGQPGKLGTTRQPHPFPGVGGYVNVKVSTKPEGVAYELADVVIRVADMAEWYGVDLTAAAHEAEERYDFDSSFPAHFGFGSWISMVHMHLSRAFEVYAKGDYIDWPSSTSKDGEQRLQIGAAVRWVQAMAAHYGIDLDAAIEAKMEYNRTRSYRHGGKAL